MDNLFGFLTDVGNYDDRKIDRYDDGDMAVSTAAVSDGRDPFETAVMHPEYNDGQWVIVESYDSRESAKAGHAKWVSVMTADTLPNELADCGNSTVSQFLDACGGRTVFARKTKQ